MQTKLNLITEHVKRDEKCRVNNVAYLLNEENLGECFRMLKKGKASGIDGTSVEEYELELESNLKLLVSKMKSQAYSLKWSDIDLEIGFINIRKSKSGQARRIPIEEGALEVLKTLDKTKKFLFSKENNTTPHKDSYIKPLQRAARRAGINKRVDLHTLRHSYGSNKIRAGWGLKKVSKLLGHSDITMTAEVYTHLLDGDLKVSDEFHFDNLEKREEKKGEGINSLDNTTVIQIIKLLQNHVTNAGENSENNKNNDAFCDAYATLNKKRNKK